MWSFVWLAVAVVIGILVFLALREGILWYWKIDEAVQLLREIRDELKARRMVSISDDPAQLLRFRSDMGDKVEPS
ncbi:hypothetical protein [Burkholderia sp. IMCC1007]|uniref:hypothetical protein n=1 Tax=Burkholderia sp. IMCC1007 TaxID=3004104 RepID=UPI0022B39DF6|nr:hypothetical protein [Burkholderia sp. IMCC1007]